MIQEKFLSGYCRQLDASRMVELEIGDGTLVEVDCLYGGCAFQTSCPIAREIEALTSE